MKPENQPLPSAPIIEAVVDIDCDLPSSLDLQQLAPTAQKMLKDQYPIFRKKFVQEHKVITHEVDPPDVKVTQGLGALQFVSGDEKQLLQFRPGGFSFNRLAPYSSMNDYFPAIEKGWDIFNELTQPVVVRKLGIRMINRILLPLTDGKLDFHNFLKVVPQLPETGSSLSFLGFLDQHTALDSETGNHLRIVKTTEQPSNGSLPLILDIEVFFPCEIKPTDWKILRERLDSLRSLKNRIFRNTVLTEKCLNQSPQA